MRKNRLLLVAIALLVVAADHLTKYIVRSNMELGDALPSADAFFRIYYTLNDGIAFSLLVGHRAELIIVQSVMVLCIIALIFYLMRRAASMPLLVALALMLGGGLGNLIDRIVFGKVTDFLSVGSFPVFNLADSCLSCGCVLMLLYVLFAERLGLPAVGVPVAAKPNAAGASESDAMGADEGQPDAACEDESDDSVGAGHPDAAYTDGSNAADAVGSETAEPSLIEVTDGLMSTHMPDGAGE
jgi:signal peptidase II